MEYLIILLKANLILSICYLIHHIWLRKLTFYNLNRFYFLAVFAIAIASPFLQIKLQASQTVEKIRDNISFEELQRQFAQHKQASNPINWPNIVMAIYLIGFAVMTLLFLIKLWSLIGIYLKSERGILEGQKIRLLKNATAPFSFFHTIFINKEAVERNDYQLILHHEMVHSQQYHSLDVLLAESFKIISWFNPIVWFLQKELRQNLEYITDEKVLALGIDAKMYQYNLLSSALYTQNVSITNHYNFSHLKNRIIMMNKDKSSKLQLTKYVLALPFVLLTSIFVQQSNAQTTPQVPEQRANKDGAAAQSTIIKAKHKQETIIVSDQKPGKSIKEVKVKVKPGADGKADETEFTVTDAKDGSERTFVAQGDQVINAKESIYLLDGKEVFELESINPDDIKSMTVYKGVSCQTLYPQYPNAKSIIAIISKKKG